MDNKLNKVVLVYLVLQVASLIKATAFFYWFGRGSLDTMLFSILPKPIVWQSIPAMFDFVFHTIMHLAILACAVYFGKHASKITLCKLIAAALAAAFIHNTPYYLTGVFTSIDGAALDLAKDFALLAIVLIASRQVLASPPQASGSTA